MNGTAQTTFPPAAISAQQPQLPRGSSDRRFWAILFAVLLLIKALLLLVDHAPMFYLGDSIAYLLTAKNGYIPPDRSFLYGWIIKWVATWTGSLQPLLWAQSLAGACSALLAGYILRQFFGAGRLLAAAAALLCAVEPLQLLLERFVMTEAISLLAFSLFVTAALAYLQRASLRRLALMQLAAIFVVAMRVSFLPMLEAATLLAPLLAWRTISPGTQGRWIDRRRARVGAHLLVSIALFAGLQYTYKWDYSRLIQTALPGAGPEYNYDEGFHILSFVAPIATPQDFPDQAHAAAIFNTPFDLKNPRERDRQRWETGGLVWNLNQVYGPRSARRLAKATAIHAVLRDPLGELRLAWFGYADYWNLEHLAWGMKSDRGGDRELPDNLLQLLREDYHLEGADLPHRVTLTNVYYFHAWGWFLALLLLPLPTALLVPLLPRPQRPGAFLLFVFASLQIAVIAACSIGPTVRFLHAMTWLGILTLTIFATRLANVLRRSRVAKV